MPIRGTSDRYDARRCIDRLRIGWPRQSLCPLTKVRRIRTKERLCSLQFRRRPRNSKHTSGAAADYAPDCGDSNQPRQYLRPAPSRPSRFHSLHHRILLPHALDSGHVAWRRRYHIPRGAPASPRPLDPLKESRREDEQEYRGHSKGFHRFSGLRIRRNTAVMLMNAALCLLNKSELLAGEEWLDLCCSSACARRAISRV